MFYIKTMVTTDVDLVKVADIITEYKQNGRCISYAGCSEDYVNAHSGEVVTIRAGGIPLSRHGCLRGVSDRFLLYNNGFPSKDDQGNSSWINTLVIVEFPYREIGEIIANHRRNII